MTDELLNERYALAIERIRQIPAEKSVPQPYRDFFAQMAQYLCKMDQIRSRIAEGYLKTASEEELAVFNREPYEDVIGERYETSTETRHLPCGHLVKRMEGASAACTGSWEMLLSGSMRTACWS